MSEQLKLVLKSELLPRLYLPLLVLLCATLSWHPLDSSSDFWAHAAVGRWIWQHGTVPHQTLFLWSVDPVPWVAHSWLTQLLFYGCMAIGGESTGPYIALGFTAVTVALMYALIWRLWASQASVTTLTALLFALTIMRGYIRYNPRPELFSGLLLTCLMVLLVRWAPAGSECGTLQFWRHVLMTAFGLPLLFLAWTNLHGGMIMGLLILGVTVLCDFVQDRSCKRSWILAGTLVLCLLVVLVNPYGVTYWQALQPVGGPLFEAIEEWKPLWAWPPPSEGTILLQGLLALIALVAWRLNPQRRTAHVAWLLLMGLAYISARRNGWLLGLTSLVVMAGNARSLQPVLLWQWLWPGLAERERLRTGEIVIPLLWRNLAHGSTVLALSLLILYGVPSRKPVLPLSAVSPNLASKMAAFIQDNYPHERLLNDYETSSYLHWRFAGHPPLFIDLLNAYPVSLLTTYGEIADFTPAGMRRLEELNIRVIALGREPQQRYLSQLQSFLDSNSQWTRQYDGEDGSVWVRHTGKNAYPTIR